MKKNVRWTVVVLFALVVLAGCELASAPVTPTASPTITVPASPLNTPSHTQENTATPTPVPFTGLTTLALWVPDFMPLYDEAGNATNVMQQIDAFNRANRAIQVDVLVKKATGSGGLYHLLDTGSQAAPEILPDLLMLNESDLHKAINASLIQPIPAPISMPTSTYPIALEATQPLTTNFAVPLLLDVEQTVYNPRLALRAPLSWTTVLSGGYSLLFPAVPPDNLVGDAVLTAYLGSGGTIVDETGEPFLDRVVLEDLYGFISDLRAQELLNVQLVSELPDAAACWEIYQERRATLSVVPAGEYWTAETRMDTPGWIPTDDGTPYGLAHIWSIALVTSDPVRQEAALELIAWLTKPEHTAEVAQQVVMLPTNRETLARWGLMPDELEFIDTLLTATILPPLAEEIDRPVRRALQAGLKMMLEEPSATPEQAATQALTVLRK